ncbi:hypothetical protein CVT24_010094, partial [Panaeolus cyanescens]
GLQCQHPFLCHLQFTPTTSPRSSNDVCGHSTSVHSHRRLQPLLIRVGSFQLNPDKPPYPEALAPARIASEGVLTWLQPAVDDFYMASGLGTHVGPIDGQQDKPRVLYQSEIPPKTATRAPEKKHRY